MRSVMKKMRIGMPAVAAASMAVLAGSSAFGAFQVSIAQTQNNVSGNDVWVVSIITDNSTAGQANDPYNPGASTGAGVSAMDVELDTSKAMIIQTTADTDGDGAADINVQGAADLSEPIGSPRPLFGATTGTFIGYGSTTLSTSNPIGNPDGTVFVNGQTTSHDPTGSGSGFGPNGVNGSKAIYATTNSAALPLDPAFLAGTVTSLEVQTLQTLTTTALRPVANIVVPHGTTGLAYVGMTPSVGAAGSNNEFYSVSFGPVVVTAKPTISLTAAAAYASAGSITVQKTADGKGVVAQVFTVPQANLTTGSLTVNGFAMGDQEEYALAIDANGSLATGSTLTSILNEIQPQVSGGTLSTIGGGLAAIFGSGYNAQFIGIDPPILNWDFTGDTTGTSPTLTSIGVVPEPTGFGVLVVGGLGLMARRRRANRAQA